MTDFVSDGGLAFLERLSAAADPPPWTPMVEGRDHVSGDSFIRIGTEGQRSADMYVSRDDTPASAAELDLIAAARSALPDLIAEVRRLRLQLEQ